MHSKFIVRSDFLLGGTATVAGGLVACSGSGGSPSPSQGAQSTPSPAPTASNSVAVLIGSTTVGSLGTSFAGLSYEKAELSSGLFASTNTSLIGCFNRLGKSLLRVGGNTVDQTTWVSGGTGGTSGQVAPPDINALSSFLTAAGWNVLYAINLASNSPQNAAAEAAFVAQTLGESLYGFEIGNQPDLYASNGIRSSTYTFSDFLTEWHAYASAITGTAPDAKLTGPATSFENIKAWTVPFAPAEDTEIILLTQHYYRGSGTSPASTIAELLAGDPALPGDFQALRAAATGSKIPGGYRMSETNNFYDGGAPGISDTYGTALWALDYMMLGAQNGCAGFNFHGGGDTAGYTPIADANDTVVDVRPEFYALLLVAQISPGPVLSVTTKTSLPFTGYAVAGGDGATYIVLINKSAATTATVSITLPSALTKGTTLGLTGAGLNAVSGTTLGGAAVTPSGAWAPLAPVPFTIAATTFELHVPAASAILLRCS